ncbi:antitoxin MazE-like protein [Vibrio cionasavignyae]|uniref:antitoxin MazE-like protein n=1 Tax=Vibrio cionasavignyae TaxID=2910252 RepID=UPI003D1319B5
MSRNKRYEEKKRAQGLVKVTLWVPDSRESEFKMLAEACCRFRHLTFNTLRDTESGKYVSLERL